MDWYLNQLTNYYRRLLEADQELSGLRKEIENGDLAALQKYSTRAGQIEVKALQEASRRDGYSSLLESDNLKSTLDAVFRENYQAVANASQTAQKAANQAAGLGIRASDSDYADIADDVANKLAVYEDVREGLDKMANDIVLQSQKYADESERKSASFANDSGLEVLVSREYDDVGVHTTDKGGGQPCQWCLDRCGTDVPYQEAYDRGMFERHPGCGCIITYRTKRGVFRQGKGDWEQNQWAEVSDRETNKRIMYSMSGDNTGSSIHTPTGKIQITDAQFGKKAGKHCEDYGLDPSKKDDREQFRRITQDIISNCDEKFSGEWRGQKGICDFYLKGNDVVVVNREENSYVTTMKGGINNARVKKARGR